MHDAFALLQTALTHKSWAVEHGGDHNERLEFLGDAVLKMVTAELLYDKRPGRDEGSLSQMLHQLVNNDNLARIGRQLGLARGLRLGRGEQQQGGRQRDGIIADTFEALLGVVYLVEGTDGARRVVHHWMGGDLPRAETSRNPISALQELTQQRYKDTPTYDIVGRAGPDHATTFRVAVTVQGEVLATGEGSSIKRARASAAAAALNAAGSADL